MAGLKHIKGLTTEGIKKDLKALPIRVAERVAARGALEVSSAAQSAYDTGRTAYDTARPLGVEGQRLTLKRTGDTRATLLFAYFGTRMRCVLGTPYAGYLIGKYGILPGGKTAMPISWRKKLDAIVAEELARP